MAPSIEELQQQLEQAQVMLRIAYSAGYIDGETRCPAKHPDEKDVVNFIRKNAYIKCAEYVLTHGWGKSVNEIAESLRSLDSTN